jgi:hypothetical protein
MLKSKNTYTNSLDNDKMKLRKTSYSLADENNFL